MSLLLNHGHLSLVTRVGVVPMSETHTSFPVRQPPPLALSDDALLVLLVILLFCWWRRILLYYILPSLLYWFGTYSLCPGRVQGPCFTNTRTEYFLSCSLSFASASHHHGTQHSGKHNDTLLVNNCGGDSSTQNIVEFSQPTRHFGRKLDGYCEFDSDRGIHYSHRLSQL